MHDRMCTRMNDMQVCAYDYLHASAVAVEVGRTRDISAKFPARLRRIMGKINAADGVITRV